MHETRDTDGMDEPAPAAGPGPAPGPPPASEPPPGTTASGMDPAGRRSGRRVLWWLLAVLVAFLAGFGWQYLRAAQVEDRLERTEQALTVERLRVTLAQAAVAAQSGEFESARRQMSEFFTAMQDRLDEVPDDVRAVGQDLLRRRDEVITGLSRGTPGSADVLYDMLQQLRAAVDPIPPAPTAPGDTAPVSGG